MLRKSSGFSNKKQFVKECLENAMVPKFGIHVPHDLVQIVFLDMLSKKEDEFFYYPC